MSGTPPTSGRSRRLRVAAFVALGIVVLFLAGALVLKAMLTPDRLRAEIIRRTTTALGVEPALQSASLTILPFGVRLEGLAIPGAAPADPPLLALDEGRVRLGLLPLLTRSVVVDEIRFVRPRIHLRKEGDRFALPGTLGETREAAGASGPKRSPGPSPLARLAIRSYAIEDGSVRVVTDGAKDDMALDGITLRGSLDAKEGGRVVSSEGTLELDGLSLAALSLYEETLKRLKPELRYRLAYDAKSGTLRIDEAALVAKPLELAGRGEIRGLPDAPVLAFAVDPGRHDVADLVPLVPTAIVPEGRTITGSGRAELGGRIEAHLADTTKAPDYEFRAVLEDVALGVEGFPAGIEKATGSVTATPKRIVIDELRGTLAGEPFRVHGTVDDPADSTRTRFDLQIEARAQLDVLARSGFAPPGGTLSGTIDADVTARGTPANPRSIQLEGNVLAEGVTAKFPDMRLPVEGARARVTLAGDRATIESLAARIGRSLFEAKGEVRRPLAKPELVLEGRAPILDLNELFPPAAASKAGGADSSRAHALGGFFPGEALAADAPPPLVPVVPPIPMQVTFAVDSLFTGTNVFTGATFHAKTKEGRADVDGRFAKAQVGTVELRDLSADATIVDGRLEGKFTAPRADAPRVPLTEVKGTFRLGEDRVLHVNDVAARLWSGAVSGNATVDLTDVASPAFHIESKATRVQANDLVSSLTPAKNFVSGAMDMSSVISGKGSVPDAIARTLSGEGSVLATDGKIELGPTVAAVWKSLGFEDAKAIRFDDLTSAFRLEGGKLVTKDLAVRGKDATWKAQGAVALDGMLDYDVQVELGEELSNTYRKRVGRDLAQVLAGSTGRLVLDLKLTGNARAPKVTVDTSKLAERAKENATDAVRKSLEKEAGKALEKILGAPSDSTKPPGAASPESTVKNLLEGLFKKK